MVVIQRQEIMDFEARHHWGLPNGRGLRGKIGEPFKKSDAISCIYVVHVGLNDFHTTTYSKLFIIVIPQYVINL